MLEKFYRYIFIVIVGTMICTHTVFSKPLNKLQDVSIAEEGSHIALNLVTNVPIAHVIKSEDNDTIQIALPNTIKTNNLLGNNPLKILSSQNLQAAKITSDRTNIYVEMTGKNIASKNIEVHYTVKKDHNLILEPNHKEQIVTRPSTPLKLTSASSPIQDLTSHTITTKHTQISPQSFKKTAVASHSRSLLPQNVNNQELPIMMTSFESDQTIPFQDKGLLAKADFEPTSTAHDIDMPGESPQNTNSNKQETSKKTSSGFSIFGIQLSTLLKVGGIALGGLILMNIFIAIWARIAMKIAGKRFGENQSSPDNFAPQESIQQEMEDPMSSHYKQFEEHILNDPDKNVKIIPLEYNVKEPESIEEAFSKVLSIKEDGV